MKEQEVKKIEPFKRFMVFAFSDYYPSGGLDDIVGSFDTIQEAEAARKEADCDYTEILDRVLGIRVCVKGSGDEFRENTAVIE